MPKNSSCIFCKIVAGEIPCHKIYEDEKYLTFLDISPISPGHSLVIPKNHSPDLLHANSSDRSGLLEIVAKVAPGILRAVGASAFNIGINTGKDSGQIVLHTHVHIIPRKPNDGMKSWENIPSKPVDLDKIAQKIRASL